jgi:hypothetical protein
VIQEVTETFYTERNNLCLLFYTDCIIIVVIASIINNVNIIKKEKRMESRDELDELLSQCNRISELNKGCDAQVSEEMPPEVAVWFGLVAVFLAENWNAGKYTVLIEDIRLYVQKHTAQKINDDQWAKAINTFCSSGKIFHLLLIGLSPSKFIINQPKVEDFWSSEHSKAFQVLYGGPDTIRLPSAGKEKEWCISLKSLVNTPIRMDTEKVGDVDKRGNVNLELIGTSSKGKPRELGHNSGVSKMVIASKYAYLPSSHGGFRIYDISNHKSISLVSVYPSPGDICWFELFGTYGILRSRSGHIEVVDLSKPDEPKVLYEGCRSSTEAFFAGNYGLALLIKDNIVIDLCHDSERGSRVFDFSNSMKRDDIKLIGKVHYDSGTATIYDNHLLMGNYRMPAIKVVSFSLTEVKEIKVFPLETPEGRPIIPSAIAAAQGMLYVISKYPSRLIVYNLNNFPEQLVQEDIDISLDIEPSGNYGAQIWHDGNWLCYVGYVKEKEQIKPVLIDIETKTRPIVYSNIEIIPNTLGAIIKDDILYCNDGVDLWIYNCVKVKLNQEKLAK